MVEGQCIDGIVGKSIVNGFCAWGCRIGCPEAINVTLRNSALPLRDCCEPRNGQTDEQR